MQIDQDIKNKLNNVLYRPDMNKIYQMEDENVVTNMNNIHGTTMSMLNRSSMMTYSKIVCCICSATIDANTKGMCDTCARSEVNITDGITKEGMLYYCKGCDRYLRPPWVRCGNSIESPEMMTMCLSKIKGLNKVKLVDSSFVWTEPHSKIIKIKLTVQKEMNKNLIETSLIVDFKVEWTQCDDCKKTFTPHIWNASVQIRQKVAHKRTFMYLEQVILKNKAHARALSIKEHPEGVDFYFSNKSQALSLADFIKTAIPAKIKQSKQLVSHDQHSNLFNYKYTFMIELAPVSKDDLIILDKETSKELGGIGPVLFCHKLCSKIHLIDPLTLNLWDYDSNSYWRHEFKSYVDRKCLEEFLIMSVDEEVDYSRKYMNKSHSTLNDVEMEVDSKVNQSKSTNYKLVANKSYNHNHSQHRLNHNHKIVNVQCIKQSEMNEGKLITTRCLLAGKIHPGDIFLGYDLNSLNVNHELESIMTNADNTPDIILVKKLYTRKDTKKRVWKLKHLEKDVEMNNRKDKKENNEDQYEEFLRDIEEDKDMRKNINLYKDDEAIKELEGKFNNLKVDEKSDDSEIEIKVDELLDELTINDKEEPEDASQKVNKKDSLDFIEQEEVIDTFVKPENKNKKHIGKRERTGNKIEES